jgi:excisionase family DNA binding protein
VTKAAPFHRGSAFVTSLGVRIMSRRARTLWPIFLSVSELADAMHVDRRTVYAMVDAGLPIYRIGVKRRMLVTDVIDFVPKFFKQDGSLRHAS